MFSIIFYQTKQLVGLVTNNNNPDASGQSNVKNSSLLLLSGPLRPSVVAHDRALWVKSNKRHTYAKLNCLIKLNSLKCF